MTSKALPVTGPDDALREHSVFTHPAPLLALLLLRSSWSHQLFWSLLLCLGPPTRALWTLWVMSPTRPTPPRGTGQCNTQAPLSIPLLSFRGQEAAGMGVTYCLKLNSGVVTQPRASGKRRCLLASEELPGRGMGRA